MAAGEDARGWYGIAGACPIGMYGAQIVDMEGFDWNEAGWTCKDNGGAITFENGAMDFDMLISTPVTTGVRKGVVRITTQKQLDAVCKGLNTRLCNILEVVR